MGANESGERTGKRLIFQDGTVVENGHCGLAEKRLWCWLPGYTFNSAFALISNNEATAGITYQYGGMEDVHEGYTVCINIGYDDDVIKVCLIQPDEQ